MILNEIELEGFLSYYTKQIVSFKNVVTALVIGATGSGKSSLFEAFAVCWYGRKASRGKLLEELINDYSETAYIRSDIEFEGIYYRRIRQWGKKKSNILLQAKDGVFVEIARDTDADVKGIEILGSWELFCTVYLKQKGIISFIEGESSHRKALLRELLALDIYQTASDSANKKLNDTLSEITLKQNEVDSYQSLLNEEPENANSLNENETALSNLKVEEKNLSKISKQMQEKIRVEQIKQSKAQDNEKRLDELKTRKKQLEDELNELISAKTDLLEEITTISTDSEDTKEIIENAKNLLETSKVEKIKYAEYKDKQLHDIEEENKTVADLNKRLSKLNKELGRYNAERFELNSKIVALRDADTTELDSLQEQILLLAKYETMELHKLEGKKLIAKSQKEISQLNQQIGTYTSGINELKQKIKKYEGCKGICPILEEPCDLIDSDENATYINSLTAQLKCFSKDLDDFITTLNATEKIVSDTEKQVEKEEQENANIIDSKKKLETYKTKIELLKVTAENNARRLKTLKEQLKKLEDELLQVNESVELIEEEIEKASKLINDKVKENALITESKGQYDYYCKMIVKYEETVAEKQKALIRYETRLAKIDHLKTKNDKNIKVYETRIEKVTNDISEIEQFDSSLLISFLNVSSGLEKNLSENKKKQDRLLGLIGELKAKSKTYRSIKAKIKVANDSIGRLKKKKEVYERLVFAFGKNGIQKSIMKSAVPELERLATSLLQSFSPGKDISIQFELDPKTKDGDLKAQGGLDILIVENGKSKSLNLYSGGETTQITFAIYLSLAELSSKRVGRRMQTLIIDERVSGLDESGIYRFAEIIEVIKKRYIRCIIITHITQLQELFDKQIHVIKKANGSIVLNV